MLILADGTMMDSANTNFEESSTPAKSRRSLEDVKCILSYHASSTPLEISMPGRERISKKTRTIHYRITRLVHTIKVWRIVKKQNPPTLPRVNLRERRLEGFDPIRSELLDMSFSKKDMSLLLNEDQEEVSNADPILNHEVEHLRGDSLMRHSLHDSSPIFCIDPTGELLSFGLDRLSNLMMLIFSGRCDTRVLPQCFNPQGLVCAPAFQSLFSICSTFTNQLHYCSFRVDFSQIFGYLQLESASFSFGDLMFNLIRAVLGDVKPIHLISDEVRLEVVLDRKGAMMSNHVMHISTPFLFRTRGESCSPE